MNYLDNPEPKRRLHVEMDVVAQNLTYLTERYEVLPMGRSALIIPNQVSDLVLGSGKRAVAEYKENLGGCQIMRSRLRLPGLTLATTDLMDDMEREDPWAWQSGISQATDAMVNWVLVEEMRGKGVVYDQRSSTLLTNERSRTLTSFIGEGIAGHCYPNESYFAQDVCMYLSQWWTVEQEVDGDLDGDEVRIDAILTHRVHPDTVVAVEFKNPQGHINALKGLTQAWKYRKVHWEGHGKLPVAYCCPGKVPSGHEAQYVIEQLRVGLLDFSDRWSLAMPGFLWTERDDVISERSAR